MPTQLLSTVQLYYNPTKKLLLCCALVLSVSGVTAGRVSAGGGGGAFQTVVGRAFGDPVRVHQRGHLDVVEILTLQLFYWQQKNMESLQDKRGGKGHSGTSERTLCKGFASLPPSECTASI